MWLDRNSQTNFLIEKIAVLLKVLLYGEDIAKELYVREYN